MTPILNFFTTIGWYIVSMFIIWLIIKSFWLLGKILGFILNVMIWVLELGEEKSKDKKEQI